LNSEIFRFKEFSLRNVDSSLKINTDGVLLAAWSKIKGRKRIIDLGTGGGVMAFILAQKTNNKSKVVGIDIDANSIKEAQFNLSLNPEFNISFLEADIRTYHELGESSFDYVISNPPFYDEEINQASSAKHTQELNFEELVNSCRKLMTDDGLASIVLPYKHLSSITTIIANENLYMTRICCISGKHEKTANRVMIEFSKNKKFISITHLQIRNANNFYTEEYKQLTKSYYLNF